MKLRHINVHTNNRSKGCFQICNNIVQFLFCFRALVFWHMCCAHKRQKQCRNAVIHLTFSCCFFSYYANAATNQDAYIFLSSFLQLCIQRLSLIIVVSQTAFWKLVLVCTANAKEKLNNVVATLETSFAFVTGVDDDILQQTSLSSAVKIWPWCSNGRFKWQDNKCYSLVWIDTSTIKVDTTASLWVRPDIKRWKKWHESDFKCRAGTKWEQQSKELNTLII